MGMFYAWGKFFWNIRKCFRTCGIVIGSILWEKWTYGKRQKVWAEKGHRKERCESTNRKIEDAKAQKTKMISSMKTKFAIILFHYLCSIFCFVHFFWRSYCWVTSCREGGSVRGSPLAAVMIYEWIVASTCDDHCAIRLQNTYLWNTIIVVSQVIFGGITLGPHVDQLVANLDALAESSLMTQLCHHYWDVNNHQQCA